MKAAVLEALNDLRVKEIPTPEPGLGEVLVKVHAASICGSDVRIFRYGNPRVKPPQVIGHEAAGEVVAVGAGVEKFRVGQRVAIGADVPCGACDWCQNGLGNNCEINYAIGYQFPGVFAEYVLLNAITVQFGPVTPLPDSVTYEQAALAEPLGCAINGLELVNLHLGQSVVLIGAGPIGCLMIDLARIMGASQVIVIQRSRRRLELAQQWGADHYLAAEEVDPVEEVKRLTNGRGADVVITTCGSVEAHEQAIEMVAHRGYVNLFGGLPKGTRNLSVPSNTIHYKECFVTGSHGCVPRHHRLAVDLIARGAVRVEPAITHRFPLDEAVEALRVNEQRLGLKAMLAMA